MNYLNVKRTIAAILSAATLATIYHGHRRISALEDRLASLEKRGVLTTQMMYIELHRSPEPELPLYVGRIVTDPLSFVNAYDDKYNLPLMDEQTAKYFQMEEIRKISGSR